MIILKRIKSFKFKGAKKGKKSVNNKKTLLLFCVFGDNQGNKIRRKKLW